jgi:hypothetical protein
MALLKIPFWHILPSPEAFFLKYCQRLGLEVAEQRHTPDIGEPAAGAGVCGVLPYT